MNIFLYDHELLGDRNSVILFSFYWNQVHKMPTHVYKYYGMKEQKDKWTNEWVNEHAWLAIKEIL